MRQWLIESARYLIGIVIGVALMGLALVWAYARRLKGPPETTEHRAEREAWERSRKQRVKIREESIREIRDANAADKARDFEAWARDFWSRRRDRPSAGDTGESD